MTGDPSEVPQPEMLPPEPQPASAPSKGSPNSWVLLAGMAAAVSAFAAIGFLHLAPGGRVAPPAQASGADFVPPAMVAAMAAAERVQEFRLPRIQPENPQDLGLLISLTKTEGELRTLLAKIKTDETQVARVTVWDNFDEDGDVVRLETSLASATVVLAHAPATVLVPYRPGEALRVTGVTDGGGGGVTLAIDLMTGPLPVAPLTPGETRLFPIR